MSLDFESQAEVMEDHKAKHGDYGGAMHGDRSCNW